MKETIKKAFLGWIVFLWTVITWFIGFAAWTDLPTQNNWDTLNSTIWNNLVNTVNNIWKSQLWIDQTWQDVSSSRVIWTTYTNNTWKPITISFDRQSWARSSYDLYINWTIMMSNEEHSAPWHAWISTIIPNWSTYSIKYYRWTAASSFRWTELR